MKQILIQGGAAKVENVAAPTVGARNILVSVRASCISAGTEMAGVRMSALPLYKRALKQPENVARVMGMMREQGVMRTLKRVQGKLAAGTATGYSAAGVVVALGSEVTGFSVGDRVACAGAGIANHAEYIDVPVNLATPLPEDLTFEHGCTVTLGAIAMQGVRRAAPTLGESFVVIGLGVLGQITAQMLSANGCRVIGIDVDSSRIDLATANGLDVGLLAGAEDVVDRVIRHCNGFGADGVIITAGGADNTVISQAMRMSRKKGRVVLVGDVGLDLNRGDFYAKELDFLISCSYGPGRYDPAYEEGGQDYPLAYVRWTENRNMEAYLGLLANGRVSLDNLVAAPFAVDDAAAAYSAFDSADRPLVAVLKYGEGDDAIVRRIENPRHKPVEGKVRVALVGASSFAQGMHLPNLKQQDDAFALHAVMSRTGANAKAIADQFGARYSTTDLAEVLGDDDTDLVLVASRHNLHGSTVLEALRAGRNVFVEKPLTLYPEELEAIEKFYADNPSGPLLMVGYNRRFAPGVQAVRELLRGRTTPMIVNYRMNAGFIPRDHWVHGPEGGGRNLGEACHIYDLFNALTGSHEVVDVHARPIVSPDPQWRANDNFVATLAYADGSVCTLTYTALGAKDYPKERMDIFCDGRVITLDDYKQVEIAGGRGKGWRSASAQKGQFEELEVLGRSLRNQDASWPIALADMLATSRTAFEVERQLTLNQQG
ncbi:bi-domain-containing oxidoreductase [Sphingomonas sp. DG1-23]|uniref:bi-domain-containing oxidoreductase n=1 Tax=Sphingomonas sp. DG1-23 TaxID=3068316 RepID=UPI00273D0810|nr:bi-domain-containing oxidoreductase [Sphingomonas sp. DG1-23]MDP5280682.1 bi-domain-containing oxidoreductase [Sphingomonas sp. DG1-23]